MKKIFPVILALTLALNLAMPALAASHDDEHGNTGNAIVAEETGGSTQFYMTIDKDATDDNNTTTSTETEGNYVDANDDRITYDITFTTTASYQLSVTIPLYVCMYAYGGDGAVVAPDASAYMLSNTSSSNDAATVTITGITKNTPYAQLKDDSTDKPNNGVIVGVSYDDSVTPAVYHYYYTAPSDVSTLTYCDVTGSGYNTAGSLYVFYDIVSGMWSFQYAGDLADGILKESVAEGVVITVTTHVVYKNVDFGTEIEVGMTDSTDNSVGLTVKVTKVQSNAATWTLMPLSNNPATLRAGEIQMSLAPEQAVNSSAIDLASALGSYDVSTNGWMIPAAVFSATSVPGTLGINVFAQIAGGSVNEAGCVPVVSVSYTVVPVFN